MSGTNDGAGVHALHIEDLVKRYPTGVEALRGVSVDIRPGEYAYAYASAQSGHAGG